MLIDAPEDQDFKVADVITDDLVLELIEALEEHQCEVCVYLCVCIYGSVNVYLKRQYIFVLNPANVQGAGICVYM